MLCENVKKTQTISMEARRRAKLGGQGLMTWISGQSDLHENVLR